MFSNACEYAIKATVYIANNTDNGSCVGVKEIAKGINAPEPYIAKILQQLSKYKLINSAKGPKGGFSIDTKQVENKIVDIVTLFDPALLINRCILGLDHCNAQNPCPMHFEYVEIRNRIDKMLNENTIASFNELLSTKKSVLKRI